MQRLRRTVLRLDRVGRLRSRTTSASKFAQSGRRSELERTPAVASRCSPRRAAPHDTICIVRSAHTEFAGEPQGSGQRTKLPDCFELYVRRMFPNPKCGPECDKKNDNFTKGTRRAQGTKDITPSRGARPPPSVLTPQSPTPCTVERAVGVGTLYQDTIYAATAETKGFVDHPSR
jgi:hypothetical protein